MVGLTFKLDRSSQTPIYIQLYEYIRNEIISGHIEPNTKLPSIRQLADFLNVSRTTVEVAYQQLNVEGYIVSKPKAGYFVNIIENNTFGLNKINEFPSNREKKTISTSTVEYDFRNDYIDKGSFDFRLWRKYLNKALMDNQERFLNYGSFQGEYELRKEIAKYVHQSRGVKCIPEQIFIGAGVQSLLNVLCGNLKPQYNIIGFEDPGFNQARHIFKDHEFEIIPINLERDGISIKSLWKSKAKIVYVSPSNQFPTGSVMSINKRIQLLNWAHENNGLIIEDDYDSELRYFGRPIPSLQGLDKGANVIYLGSFSKILLPAIRISYMILPQDLCAKYMEKITKYNQTASKLEQLALALFMEEGMLEKHIRKLRKIYARKNQLLIETINRIMHKKVKVLAKETGLHVLLELKTNHSPEKIAYLAERVGVKVNPISNYSISSKKSEYPLVLLSYGGIPIEHIEPAVGLLNRVWFETNL